MSIFTNPASGSKEHASAYTRAILDLVGDDDPVAILRATPESAARIVEGLDDAALSAPESAGKWSIRHVLRHLADSDLVWAWRLRMALAHDRPPITGYDQDAWAERLGYAQADAAEALEEFRVVRRGNLRLIERATPADLKRVGVHAERGEESVEHMLRLYAGHDRLHLRQLERIRAVVRG